MISVLILVKEVSAPYIQDTAYGFLTEIIGKDGKELGKSMAKNLKHLCIEKANNNNNNKTINKNKELKNNPVNDLKNIQSRKHCLSKQKCKKLPNIMY